jgi:MFS family permease
MSALGLADSEIGLIATIYTLSQAVFAFLSGPITDKLGRRKTTAVFDFFAWSVPCLIWVMADNFWFFLIAAICNGAMKVPTNSWDCLMVEDAEKSQITRIYALAVACGHLSALFAPISSLLVAKLTLIPAVRILYINAFAIMTAKLLILYRCSRETKTGVIRMRETKGKSVFSLALGYGGVLRLMRASPGTVFSLGIAGIAAAATMINAAFWQIIVSRKLEVPDSLLPLLPMFRSAIALLFFFTVIPRLTRGGLRNPLLLGFGTYLIGQVLLVLTPARNIGLYPMLCVSMIFDGFGAGLLAMIAESLVALHVNAADRARVMAIQHMVIMAGVSPFGWISGKLSGVSRDLPFALTAVLLFAGIALTARFYVKASAAQETAD